MRRKIDLYIDGQKADLQDDALILMDYAVTDVQKPTAVRNTYSKTVTLPGTPANDRIFGHAFRLDRSVNGTGFNPLVRTPFKIYADTGEILQSGYLKLDKVDRGKNTQSYSVTLYGGLGSLMWGLSYDKAGNALSLASLQYSVSDRDFYFTVNRAAVADAWARLNNGQGQALWDIVNFAPCYNGLPSTIEADKARRGTSYNTVVTLSRKYTEWETRDLRAQLQRPAIRVRKVVEAIQDYALTLGKTLTLDPAFFRTDNPYYDKAWMLLPLLTAYEDASAGQVGEPSTALGSDTVTASEGSSQWANVILQGDTFSSDPDTGAIDFSGFDPALYLKGTVSLMGDLQDTAGLPVWGKYLGQYDADTLTWHGTLIGLQAVISASGVDIAVSRPVIVGGFSDESDARLQAILAAFGGATEYDTAGDSVGQDSYYFTFDNVPVAASDSVEISFSVYAASDDTSGGDVFRLYNSNAADVPGYIEGRVLFGVSDAEFTLQRPAGIQTNTTITKKMLLADTATPADFLLSYCKQFGLNIIETEPDKISILSRNTFYQGGVVDLTERLDRASMKETPLLFNKKWQHLGLTVAASQKAKDYEAAYGRVFGDINLDTGTEFNAEREDLLDKSCFKGGVFGKWASPLMYDFYDGTTFVNPALLAGYQWGGSTTYPTYDTRRALNADAPGYDVTGKVFGFTKDDAGLKAVDISGTLVFFAGIMHNPGMYFLTDNYPDVSDTPIVCWQMPTGNDAYSTKVVNLPVFSRYMTDANGVILQSWDFGTPAEIYDPTLNIGPASSIYTRFWEAFVRDRFDKSGKALTAKVDLRGLQVGPGLLRNFYYYGGAYWVLSKITNYSLTTWDLAECEFLQVQGRGNFTNGQIL